MDIDRGYGKGGGSVVRVVRGPMSLPVPPVIPHLPYIYGGPAIGNAVKPKAKKK